MHCIGRVSTIIFPNALFSPGPSYESHYSWNHAQREPLAKRYVGFACASPMTHSFLVRQERTIASLLRDVIIEVSPLQKLFFLFYCNVTFCSWWQCLVIWIFWYNQTNRKLCSVFRIREKMFYFPREHEWKFSLFKVKAEGTQIYFCSQRLEM